jgi:hypothetical protein
MGPAAQVTPRAPQSAEASAAPDTETHEQAKNFGVDQRLSRVAGLGDVGPLHGIPTDVLGTSPSSDVDEDRHGRC